MSSWLDTETKALLKKSPPSKLAPPQTEAFTLVLLKVYRHDASRLARAIERICGHPDQDLARHLETKLPVTVGRGLTQADALLGQFELICCDAISVFIPDEVIENATPDYLGSLYATLQTSDEFAETMVRINWLPRNDRTDEFIDQFLGVRPELPTTVMVFYKKARIMRHWVKKIGGKISLSPYA